MARLFNLVQSAEVLAPPIVMAYEVRTARTSGPGSVIVKEIVDGVARLLIVDASEVSEDLHVSIHEFCVVVQGSSLFLSLSFQ